MIKAHALLPFLSLSFVSYTAYRLSEIPLMTAFCRTNTRTYISVMEGHKVASLKDSTEQEANLKDSTEQEARENLRTATLNAFSGQQNV